MPKGPAVAALLTCLVLAGCSDPASGPVRQPEVAAVVTFPGAEVSGAQILVQIADTSEERTRGLMGVRELPRDRGMAFLWTEPHQGSFWMKNTLIPLSIAFIGEDGRVARVMEMRPCMSDPCPTYDPRLPYIMAIEANAGWFDEHGIDVGDPAELGGVPE